MELVRRTDRNHRPSRSRHHRPLLESHGEERPKGDSRYSDDAFSLAGLRRQVDPGGDMHAAYRQWDAEQMEEHDRTKLHLLKEFDHRSRSRGR